ncbi:MAG: response regulator transcription factor [Burkholderiaceae bacterium]|nr:response regulator transcription factor [Burkholderiaceae bacterium]
MIHVLLADDHSIVRDGLRALLDAESDIRVTGDAANGREAVRLARQLHPDVMIMDIAMPEMNGIEATRSVREVSPSTQVLILSMHSTIEHVFRALNAGASGYLLKDSAGGEVADAVRAVHARRRYLSQKISSATLDAYVFERHRASPLDRLNPRERQILQLVSEGKSSAEAAAMLFLSPKTVDAYRSRMMQKLEIGDLPGLVKFAIQHGITQLE